MGRTTASPPAPGPLRRPLDFLTADHHRHRVLCRLADTLAAKTGSDPGLARSVGTFISRDMAIHVIDEEQDLFPLLRRRAVPEDAIDAVLGRLAAEHGSSGVLAARLGRALDEAALTARPLDRSTRLDLAEFARGEREHLALENAIVMPLARLRLTTGDLRALSLRMAARRGLLIDDPGPSAA
ncbi:MAG: hemerythrin domain-containing protein [Geminicoccaceae bacterium]